MKRVLATKERIVMAKLNSINEMNCIMRNVMIDEVNRLLEKEYTLEEIADELDMSDSCVREVIELVFESYGL